MTDADNPGAGAITRPGVLHLAGRDAPPVRASSRTSFCLPAGDLAFQSANGRTFRVTEDLAGLSLRVKAIYQDADGVTETVFSAPPRLVIDRARMPADVPSRRPGPRPPRAARASILSAPTWISSSTRSRSPKHTRPARISSRCCRTCARRWACARSTAQFNNLVNIGGTIDQTEFGAADNPFPAPARSGVRSQRRDGTTSYRRPAARYSTSQPRTISNLIVDQTANNPAAYANAYDAGLDGVLNTAPAATTS